MFELQSHLVDWLNDTLIRVRKTHRRVRNDEGSENFEGPSAKFFGSTLCCLCKPVRNDIIKLKKKAEVPIFSASYQTAGTRIGQQVINEDCHVCRMFLQLCQVAKQSIVLVLNSTNQQALGLITAFYNLFSVKNYPSSFFNMGTGNSLSTNRSQNSPRLKTFKLWRSEQTHRNHILIFFVFTVKVHSS